MPSMNLLYFSLNKRSIGQIVNLNTWFLNKLEYLNTFSSGMYYTDVCVIHFKLTLLFWIRSKNVNVYKWRTDRKTTDKRPSEISLETSVQVS